MTELRERMPATEYTLWIALHNVRAREAEKRQRAAQMRQGRF